MKHLDKELLAMTNSNEKRFSSNLISIQMQLKALMEESGGDKVTDLLDTLCQLGETEQRIILNYFTNVVKKITLGDLRLTDPVDSEKKSFEDNLYNDLIKAFEYKKANSKTHLEVISGGKDLKNNSKVIKFTKGTQEKLFQ